MATKLDKPLKRELDLNGEPWMLTIMPEGLKLVPKGKRKRARAGVEGHRQRVGGTDPLASVLPWAASPRTDRRRRLA
jgi:hypothetical protein